MSAVTGGTRAHHINLRSEGCSCKGGSFDCAGGSTHQRVRDEKQCLSVLCVTQEIQGRENRYMLMMHLIVHHPEVLLATAKISASPRH